MPAPDLIRVKEIFAEALERTGPARAAYLEHACAADPALRAEVDAFLAAAQMPDALLGRTVTAAPLAEHPGTRIGRYKLLQQIGEGGFGVVFMAEQESPVRRQVALKIIKPGMDSKQVIARFDAERQALALMDHPNIARVFDAGATDTGRPYFVMELVKGDPITEYCNTRNLPIPQRIALFSQICLALQHAHQKGLIHRDLKPSNVLVATLDDHPVAKVIDFGIAKAMGARLTDHTLFTDFRQFIGTPAYMSPEQAQGSLETDTRSDIYALGVLLYELLAGSPPFDPRLLRSAAFAEMQRIIREVDPPTPSTRAADHTATPAAVAQHRSVDPRKLPALLHGELDWIIMRCLEKDRTRRYQNAGDLADDLARHLADQPVLARPATRRYRARKFIRRNKAAVLAATLIAAALLAGATLATIGFVQARHQAQIARTEALRSAEVAKFLKNMLAAAGPSVAHGRDATLLRDIFDKSSIRIGAELHGQPGVQGDLWTVIAHTYAEMGDQPRAIIEYQHAIDAFRSALPSSARGLAADLGALGQCQCFTGDIAHGAANAQEALDLARKLGDPATLAYCLSRRAHTFESHGRISTEGEPYLREAFSIYKRIGSTPLEIAYCTIDLAEAIPDNQSQEKLSLMNDAVAIDRKYLPPDDSRTAFDLYIRGQFLNSLGRFSEAEADLRQTYEDYVKYQDKKNWYQWVVRYSFVDILASLEKWQEAERIMNEAIDLWPANTAEGSLILLRIKLCQNDFPAALALAARAAAIDPKNDNVQLSLAVAYFRTGHLVNYSAMCHQMLTDTLKNDWRPAAVSLLLPIDGPDLDIAYAVADATHPQSTSGCDCGFKMLKCAADYRRGRFDAAISAADSLLNEDGAMRHVQVGANVVQALAFAHLGKIPQARVSLAKARQLRQHRFDFVPGEYAGGWGQYALVDQLLREAAGLPQLDAPHSP